MKIIRKSFLLSSQVLLSIVVVAFLCVCPFSILPNLLKSQSEVNRNEKYEYQGILELWHVETFEGGSVSRKTFLEREAINFESKHKGTYISVLSMTLEQFYLNIEAGKKPNMLSFGIGVGDITNELIILDAENVRSDLLVAGKIGLKQFAVPYILGGYALLSTGSGTVGVGTKGTTNPLKVLQYNKIDKNNVKVEQMLDSYNTYDKFLKGEFDSILGTQRDVYRCNNRQQKGLLNNLNYNFLGGYTDLVQFMSVFKSTEIEETLCQKFVSMLISSDVQQKLSSYNLFSVLNNVYLYNTGIYSEFENILSKRLEAENVFLSLEQIELEKQNAYNNVLE